jgi:hypothetical protein
MYQVLRSRRHVDSYSPHANTQRMQNPCASQANSKSAILSYWFTGCAYSSNSILTFFGAGSGSRSAVDVSSNGSCSTCTTSSCFSGSPANSTISSSVSSTLVLSIRFLGANKPLPPGLLLNVNGPARFLFLGGESGSVLGKTDLIAGNYSALLLRLIVMPSLAARSPERGRG